MTPATVLVVCTGNICRSPAVERLLRAGLADQDVVVRSAGTWAVVGHPISGPMVPLLVGAGAATDDFEARQLTAAMVDGADLVLGLTREHRHAVTDLVPAAAGQTFTLRELARIVRDLGPAALPGGDAAARLRELVARADHVRATGPSAGAGAADDVVDPYGGGSVAYGLSFGQLSPAVATVVAALRG